MSCDGVFPTESDPALLDSIRSWVRHQCGITFDREQDALFADRIAALCRELTIDRQLLFTKLVGGDRAITLRVAEAVSTNYTFFFREPELFDYFARHILTSLPDEPLRLWSAATSSGDEAYSLAIVAHERFGDEALARVRILGTDLSDRQLLQAERAVYPREQLAEVSAVRRARWFTPVGSDGAARVHDSVRQTCTFRRLNLTQTEWPFEKRFHVIFLRNVLYYFDTPTRRRLLEACFDVTEPGGYLITSLTEPMIDVRTRWHPVRPAVFRKRPS